MSRFCERPSEKPTDIHIRLPSYRVPRPMTIVQRRNQAFTVFSARAALAFARFAASFAFAPGESLRFGAAFFAGAACLAWNFFQRAF